MLLPLPASDTTMVHPLYLRVRPRREHELGLQTGPRFVLLVIHLRGRVRRCQNTHTLPRRTRQNVHGTTLPAVPRKPSEHPLECPCAPLTRLVRCLRWFQGAYCRKVVSEPHSITYNDLSTTEEHGEDEGGVNDGRPLSFAAEALMLDVALAEHRHTSRTDGTDEPCERGDASAAGVDAAGRRFLQRGPRGLGGGLWRSASEESKRRREIHRRPGRRRQGDTGPRTSGQSATD